MGDVEKFIDHIPMDYIGDLKLYRRRDGHYILTPTHVEESFFEGVELMSSRFTKLSVACRVGTHFLNDLASEFFAKEEVENREEK